MVVAALRTELFFVRPPKRALGVGERAVLALKEVLAQNDPCGVIIVGYAGGLRPELAPTTLILADRLLSDQGEILLRSELLAQAQEILPEVIVGPIFTDKNLAKKERKAELKEKAVAVDMESFFLGAILADAGVPYLVLRAVLDGAEEEVGWPIRFFGRAIGGSWKIGRAAEALRGVVGGRDA